MGKRKYDKNEYIKIDSKAADGGYGWVVLICQFIIAVILDGCMYSFGMVLVHIKEYYGLTQQFSNLIYSLNTGLYFSSGTIAKALCEQFGFRPVIMSASLVTALVNTSIPFIASPYLVVIVYGVIGGISFGIAYLSSMILLVKYFDKKLGIANGIQMAGSGFGAFLIPFITKYFLNNYDWMFTMIIYGCLMMQCVVIGTLLRKPPSKFIKKSTLVRNVEETEMKDLNDSNKENDLDKIEKVTKASETKPEAKNKKTSLIVQLIKETFDFKLLKTNLSFSLMCISNLLFFSAYMVVFVFIPIRGKEVIGDNYSLIISIIGIVNIPARILIGLFVDRKILSPIDINSFFIFISTICIMSYYFLHHFWMQCIFAVIFAIAIAGINTLSITYVRDLVGRENFGTANGILNIFRGFAAIIGPIIAGLIYDKTKFIFYPFLFIACSFFVAFLFSFAVSVQLKLRFIIKLINSRRSKANLEPTTNVDDSS